MQPSTKTEQPIHFDEQATSTKPIRSVLVVDDSKMQRKILTTMLKRWGYDVIEADSGEKALEICKSSNPGLILSDWMMPGMSGIEFCEAYRTLGLEDYSYFILLTSRNEKADIALGLESGADDFLTKPVNATELRGRIIAGERLLSMQLVVNERNKQLSETLTKLQTVYRAIDRDLDEARRLQQSLVPDRFRAFVGGQVSFLLHPSGHIGGDLVGAFRVSENRIGVFGIDVAGHGIASALMTARLAGYLTSSSPDQNIALTVEKTGKYSMRPPSEVCASLNRLICDDVETQHYFTMLLADCDLQSGRIVMAQAGHPNPIIMRSDGRAEFIGDGGMPIGLIESAEYADFEFRLGIDERFLIHSDGFTECTNVDGRMLNEEGLIDFARKQKDQIGQAFLEGLVNQLMAFSGSNEFPDDVSACLLDRGDAEPN